MASVPDSSAAPSLFLRNATGLVKGWSGFDAFTLLVHVGQPRHAGHVLQPGGLRLRARREPDPVDRPGRRRGHVPGRRLRRAHRGDAAGRWRLHLAEPGPRRDPRHADRCRRRRHRLLPRRPMPWPWATRSPSAPPSWASSSAAIIGRLNGGIGFVLAATGWWFILAMWAPIYGAILNIEFFQPLAALVKSSDGLSFFASENGILFVSIVDHHPDVRPRRARHGRLRADPEVVPVPRPDRPGHHVRADARLEPGRLQGRLRPGQREPVRRSPAPTTRRSPTPRSTTPGSRPSPRRTWAATCRTRCSRRWP